MDDFAAHTYRRFDAVDQRFDSIERRMEDGFKKVDEDIGGLRTEMNQRFDALIGHCCKLAAAQSRR